MCCCGASGEEAEHLFGTQLLSWNVPELIDKIGKKKQTLRTFQITTGNS